MRNKIVKTETVAKGKFVELLKINWQDSEGEMQKWEAVRRTTGTDIVSVIPVTDDGKIILIKQYRPPVNREVIEFPAGLVDKGESFEEAAQRETKEETGYWTGRIIKLFAGPVSAGLSDESLTVFLATNLKFVGKKDGREERGITVYVIPLEEVDEWLDSKEREGVFTDVKVRSSISYVKNILPWYKLWYYRILRRLAMR